MVLVLISCGKTSMEASPWLSPPLECSSASCSLPRVLGPRRSGVWIWIPYCPSLLPPSSLLICSSLLLVRRLLCVPLAASAKFNSAVIHLYCAPRSLCHMTRTLCLQRNPPFAALQHLHMGGTNLGLPGESLRTKLRRGLARRAWSLSSFTPRSRVCVCVKQKAMRTWLSVRYTSINTSNQNISCEDAHLPEIKELKSKDRLGRLGLKQLQHFTISCRQVK